jgi:UDP-glucose 4-epimerase
MQSENQPKILITGSGSFVGNGYRKFSSYQKINEVSVRFSVPEVEVFRGYHVVIHVAAIVHQSARIPEREYMSVNRDLTLRVAENAKKGGVNQFIFLSTVKVYGSITENPGPWSENSACLPKDPYGRSKFLAEEALKKLNDDNFTVSIIRTPLIYGPGVKANMLALMKLIRYCPVLPLGGINNQRHYTYIGNLCNLIDLIILKRASGTFIALDKDPVSTTTLMKMIADSMSKKIRIFEMPEFLSLIVKTLFPRQYERIFSSLLLENTFTTSTLGYDPPFPSDTGIRVMVSDFLKIN